MPIVAADLIAFGSANRPENDTTTSGGAIDLLTRPEFNQLTANTTTNVVSSGEDTRTVTIVGRNTAGATVAEVLTLTGVTIVAGAQVFERLQRALASATNATNNITVRQGTGSSGLIIGTIPSLEKEFYMFFRNSASEAGATNRYEKLFWKNNHATLTLNSAKVTLTADPSARIKIALAATKNDSGSVTNRKTPPGLVFSDDNVDLAVPGDTLEALSAIGTWVEEGLLANDAAFRSTYTTRLQGTTV